MSKQIGYVGIDVGAEELWVSVAGVRPKRFAHTEAGIRGLYQWVVKQAGGTRVHVCLEATGVYGMHVAFQLVTRPDLTVSVVNPACIAAFAKAQLRRTKTDQVDAEVIRCYAQSQQPRPWQPASKNSRQLYELVAQADILRESIRQWRNRFHAYRYIPGLPDTVVKTARSTERSLQRQLKKVEAAIDQLCAGDADLAQKILLLETIPGIARLSAVKLLAYGQQWLTERSGKALVAHAGLAPHHLQSGTSVRGKSRIDKRGNDRLRKTLYMPALVGIVHNPALQLFYQRLCANGKPKKLALVAAMKKLLLIVRAMLINKQPFNPVYQLLT